MTTIHYLLLQLTNDPHDDPKKLDWEKIISVYGKIFTTYEAAKRSIEITYSNVTGVDPIRSERVGDTQHSPTRVTIPINGDCYLIVPLPVITEPDHL